MKTLAQDLAEAMKFQPGVSIGAAWRLILWIRRTRSGLSPKSWEQLEALAEAEAGRLSKAGCHCPEDVALRPAPTEKAGESEEGGFAWTCPYCQVELSGTCDDQNGAPSEGRFWGNCRYHLEREHGAEEKAGEGKWVCSACGNVESKEREIICWKCGKGEMQYRAATSECDELRKALEEIVAVGSRLASLSAPPRDYEIMHAYNEVDRIARRALLARERERKG